MSTWLKRIAWTLLTAGLVAGTRAAGAGEAQRGASRYVVDAPRIVARPGHGCLEALEAENRRLRAGQ